MKRHGVRARNGWLLAVAAILLFGSSCSKDQSPATQPTPTYSAAVTVSPEPSLNGSPSGTSGQSQNLPSVFYVVGGKGINGTAVIAIGTKTYSITNNDSKTHQLDLFKISANETADDISKAAASSASDWTTKVGRVAVRGPVQPGQVTKQVRIAGIKPGSYALVDVAPARGGKPYAANTAFVLLLQVMETP